MNKSREFWLVFYLLMIGLLMPIGSGSSIDKPGSDNPKLMYMWLLKQVIYKKTQKSFIPKTYTFFRIFSNGRVVWYDGCNMSFARYKIHKDLFNIYFARQTLKGCMLNYDDVDYPSVTHYIYEDKNLTLHTPSQIYILGRFPFTRMSITAWSLHSIIDRTTNEVRDIYRFRMAYQHLFLRIQDDRIFEFTDLDEKSYTGTVKVEEEGNAESGGAIQINYDKASQERLRNKEKTYDYLSDSNNHYQKTAKKYATYYADELHWQEVTHFKADDEQLLFYTEDEIYKFEPR